MGGKLHMLDAIVLSIRSGKGNAFRGFLTFTFGDCLKDVRPAVHLLDVTEVHPQGFSINAADLELKMIIFSSLL